MRLGRLCVVLSFTLASCRESISPDLGSLVGQWADTPYVDKGGISYQQFLTIRADRSYTRDFRIHAAASASEPGELIGYSIADGHFFVRSDSLFMQPDFLRTWDRYFNSGKESVSQADYILPQPGQPDRSGSRFDVSEETLRLHYLSYPADAPVETEATYFRVR